LSATSRSRCRTCAFRVNAFVQQRGAAAVMRTIPSKILSLEDLKAPKIFAEIADQPRGIVLVTADRLGQIDHAGSMVNYINENEHGHILTIEDPIEFVHESKKCLINQRESARTPCRSRTRCAARCARTRT